MCLITTTTEFFDGNCIDVCIPCPHCKQVLEQATSNDKRPKRGVCEEGRKDEVHGSFGALSVGSLERQEDRKSSLVGVPEECLLGLKECMERIMTAQSAKELWLRCPRDASVMIPLSELCPDLLLLDLPRHYHPPHEDVCFEEGGEVLGRGGEGVVYEGVYEGQKVAVKQCDVMVMGRFKEIKLKRSGRVVSLDEDEENEDGKDGRKKDRNYENYGGDKDDGGDKGDGEEENDIEKNNANEEEDVEGEKNDDEIKNPDDGGHDSQGRRASPSVVRAEGKNKEVTKGQRLACKAVNTGDESQSSVSKSRFNGFKEAESFLDGHWQCKVA